MKPETQRRLAAIERRLAKVPTDLSTCSMQGQTLGLLFEDLRWLATQLKSAEATIDVMQKFSPLMERFAGLGGLGRKTA